MLDGAWWGGQGGQGVVGGGGGLAIFLMEVFVKLFVNWLCLKVTDRDSQGGSK